MMRSCSVVGEGYEPDCHRQLLSSHEWVSLSQFELDVGLILLRPIRTTTSLSATYVVSSTNHLSL